LLQAYGSVLGVGGGVGGGGVGMMHLTMQLELVVKAPPALGTHV
jgi:hypothetical protein